jgi:hypothetical protein
VGEATVVASLDTSDLDMESAFVKEFGILHRQIVHRDPNKLVVASKARRTSAKA